MSCTANLHPRENARVEGQTYFPKPTDTDQSPWVSLAVWSGEGFSHISILRPSAELLDRIADQARLLAQWLRVQDNACTTEGCGGQAVLAAERQAGLCGSCLAAYVPNTIQAPDGTVLTRVGYEPEPPF